MKVPLKMHQMPISECIFVPLCTFLVFPLHVLEIMQLCISNATALLEVACYGGEGRFRASVTKAYFLNIYWKILEKFLFAVRLT